MYIVYILPYTVDEVRFTSATVLARQVKLAYMLGIELYLYTWNIDKGGEGNPIPCLPEVFRKRGARLPDPR